MANKLNKVNINYSGFSTENYMSRKKGQFYTPSVETPMAGQGIDPSKFREYLGEGFDISQPGIERKRAEAQPWYEQAGAFANQAIVGEVIGGTIMTLGALAEIPQLVYDGLTESESGFTNAIYEAGDNLSKMTRDVTPIYQTGDRFTDSGWWFQNGVSVASAASMLLPGAGVAKGVGKLGQLMKLSKTATGLAETGLGALTMRHAENFREANGVFQSVYNEALSKGLDEESARKNASDAAALDYGTNYANLAFDVVQLGALMKPLKSWTRNIGELDYDLAKGLGRLPESKLGKAMYWSKDKLLPQVSEGVEEVVNTISQKEAERQGRILNDPSSEDNTTLVDRLGNYLGDSDVTDSFIWGVAGGAAFQGIGKLLGIDQSSNVVQNKLSEVAKRQETLGGYLQNISLAANKEAITDSSGNIIEDFREADKSDIDRYVNMQLDKMAFDLSQSASRSGNVDLLLEQIDSPDFTKQMIDSGITTPEEARERVSKIKNEVELGEKLYKQSFNRFYNLDVDQSTKNYLTDQATALEYGRAKVSELKNNLSKEYNDLYSNDEYLKAYGANPAVQNTIDIMSHQMALEGLTQQLSSASKLDKEDIQNTINKINTSLETIQANRFGSIDPNLINPAVYEAKAKQLVLQHQFDNLSDDIANTQTEANINNTKKKVETIKQGVSNNVSNNEVVKKKDSKKSRVESNKAIITDTSKFTLRPEDVPSQEEIDADLSTDVVEDLGEDLTEEVEPTEDLISSNEYKDFVDNNKVSSSRLEDLANKTINREDLSPRETAIYNSKTAEINAIIRNIAGNSTEQSDKLLEYNTKKDELDSQRANALSQLESMESYEGVDLSKEKSELEQAYQSQLKELNKVYSDSISEGEKIEIEVQNTVEKTSNIVEGYTDEGDREVSEDLNSIDDNILDKELVTKLVDSYNAIARLDREYTIKKGKYVEVNNELHPNLYKPILNPDKYQPGTEVTLRVANKDYIPITDPVTGLTTTWGDIKGKSNYVETVPIEIVDSNNNVIGYYHDISWISNPNKTVNFVEDAEIARDIRKYIVDKGEVKTTITQNKFGVLNRTVDNKKISFNEAVEDPNVIINIAQDNTSFFGDNNDYNLVNRFENTPLRKGFNYMVVKIGKKLGNDAYLAIPIDNMKYDELFKHNEDLFHKIHHSLETAINVYIKDGNNLTDGEKSLLDACKRNLDIDISIADGFKSYMEGFLYNDKRDFSERNQFKFDNNTISFRRKKPIAGQPVQFFTGRNIKDREGSLQILHNNLESMLKVQIFNTSKDFLINNVTIPLVDENGTISEMNYKDLIKSATKTNILGKEVDTNPDGSKAYSYTVQKVIRFDESFANPKPTGTDDTTTSIVNDIVEESDVEYEELLPQEFNFVDDGSLFAVTEDKLDSLSNSLKGLLVKDLGFSRQNDIVNYISEKILSKLSTDRAVNISKEASVIKESFTKNTTTIDFNIKKLKSNIIKANQANKSEDKIKFEKQLESLEAFKNLLNQVNSNWSTLVTLATKKIERLNGIKIIDNAEDDTVTENDLFEIEGDENANWKESDLTTDRKNSISRDAKLFCSGILDLDKKGQPTKTWIGTNRLMSFDVVFNTVQALTPNLPPNIDAIKNQLSNYIDANPWLSDFIEKLDKANAKTQKSLVKAITNYYSNTTGYKYSTDNKGNYFVRLFRSDATNTGKLILSGWESNFMKSNLVSTQDISELNSTEVNKWLDKFSSVESKGVRVTIEDIDGLLKDVGINLTSEALDHIKVQGIPTTRKDRVELKNIMSNSFSPLVVIKKFLELNKGKELTTKLTTETAIEKLAAIQNRYETKLHSNSQRSGGRTIFSYGKPKYFINRFRRFTDFATGKDMEMKSILNSPFVTNLYWAKLLKDSKTRESFLANFDYEIADLEPISELGKSSKSGRELNNLSPIEVELHALFGLSAKRADKSGNKQRIISLKYPTTSDKTTVHSIVTNAADLRFNEDGTLTEASYKILYDNLILPEITRIRHFEALRDKGVNISQYEGWADGWNKFMVIPEMNSYPQLFIGEHLNPDLETSYQNIIDTVLKPHIGTLISDKLALWDEYSIGVDGINDKGKVVEVSKYLDKTYKEFLVSKGGKNNVRLAAINDMVGQYLIGNVNSWGLFTTDPAQYFDKKALKAWNGGNKDQAIQKVFENMGKRLAADIAPGEESVANDGGTITYAFVKDPKVTSLRYEQLKEQFGDDIADAYKGMDGTDAQEFVTLQEHLFNMDADGLLPDGMYDIVSNTIESEIAKGNHYYTQAILNNLNVVDPKLAESFKHLVFQVKKPVYAENVWNSDLGVERRLYVKSSAYPLTPELCAKIQMDDVRIAMEKQGIQRLAFGTATKVGNYKKNVEIFDTNGNVLPNIDFSISKMVVPRSGLRDQMPVPYDPMKKEIKKVSQASKNLFVNIKDIPGMAELEKEYLDTYHAIFKEQYSKLISDIVKEDDTINVDKLKSILLEEAAGRGYPLSDYQMLELDTNLRLLPFSSNAAKYEALLNSIVENRVDKIMIPGKSFVLSTEMGYKVKPIVVEGKLENIKGLEGVVFTKNFTGELLPQRIENGVVKPAQVIMPFKFRDNEGNLLDVKDFTGSDGLIDYNKLPENILKILGMRIPNQGQNSQSSIEIIGFMPHSAGDVIVATQDYLAQMGSDFDVDKLYTYMYETTFKDGILSKKDSLKNKVVDIHLAIHANPDPRVQRQIAKPIGEWKLKSIASEVVELTKKKSLIENPDAKTIFSPASDSYQKMKFINATAGKSGVSTYSVASMFVANAQGKNLLYRVQTDEGKYVPISLVIGDTTWNGDLSNIYTIKSQNIIKDAGGYENLTPEQTKQLTYKSEVVEGHQSVAVDNEKLQLMDKTNDNKFTFNFTTAAMAAGFEDELVWLRSQPIIFDYVRELQFLKSPVSGFYGDAETEAFNRVVAKYKIVEDRLGSSKPELLTISNMKDCISGTSSQFVDIQQAAIETFLTLQDVGKKIQSITSATNTDSKGIGITVLENLSKQKSVQNLTKSNIENAERLLGKFNEDNQLVEPETIAGFATYYGLNTSNKYLSQLFPYNTNTVQDLFNTIEAITGTVDAGFTTKANNQQEIWNGFKSYLFSRNDLGIVSENTDVNAERDRLFIDRKDKKGTTVKKSFISTMSEIAELHEMKRRPFINRLNFTIDYSLGKASRISFNAAAAENLEETEIYQDIIDLIVTDRPIPNTDITSRQMMEDLIKTQYLGGGIQEAIQFIKYIPAQYYHLIPFAEKLSNIWNELNIPDNNWLNFRSDSLPNFIEQWIQHNPNKATDVDPKLFKMNRNKTFIVESEDILFKDDNDSTTAEPYIKRYNPKASPSKTELFKFTNKFDNGKPIYTQIPTLGTFGMMEYNANLPQGNMQQSLLMNITTSEVSSKETVTNGTSDTQVNPSDQLNRVEEISARLDLTTKASSLKEVLNNVGLLTQNPYNQILANELSRLATSSISINNSINTSGKTLKDYSVEISTDKIHNPSRLADVILHESLHSIGYSTISKFLTSKAELPTKVREACTSLETLRLKLLDSVKNTKEYKEWQNKMNQVRSGKDVQFTSEEVTKFSSLENLQEFFAYALTREETQKWLNSIEYKDTRTMLDRFVELFNKMIQSLLGKTTIQEGTALHAAIRDSIIILNAEELYESNPNTKRTLDTAKFTITPGDFTTEDLNDLYAVYEEEPFNSLPSRKEVYSKFKIWDNNLNRPKTWGMNVNRDTLVKIAQNINSKNDIYAAQVVQQPFLDSGRDITKQFIKLTLRPEMNSLNTRMEYLIANKDKLEELSKVCKY